MTSTVGPLPGFAYLITIATAFLIALATRARLLTPIPGVGGLLALRSARAAIRRAGEIEAKPGDLDGYRDAS